MRLTTAAALAGLAVLATASEAWAFGRAGFARRGAAVGPRGAVAGGARGHVAAGPFGGVHAGGAQGRTYVGPRGTTVQAGRVGGASVGPAGGVRTGGASGVRVTNPYGQTYTAGRRGGAAVGPYGGVRAGGAAGAAAVGPYGSSAVGRRGGVAVGPAGGVAAGRAVAGHATGYYGPTYLRTTGAAVRGYRYPYFTPAWSAAHTAAWVAPRWVAPVWTAPAWPAVSAFVGVAAPPVDYDYGGTVVIHDDTVYVNGEASGSAADYARQAVALADTGRQAKPADAGDGGGWQPLGVFGLVQGDEQLAQRVFQLGVSKAGVVRGNYYDAVADNTLPVYGSVDLKTQRVAWSVGEKKDVVFEAGLTNLTRPEAAVLVHFGPDSTQQMALVRLEEPQEGQK